MAQSFPKVSVLVPAFNEAKYILQTLDALLSQDYPNYEVIVINNASTDNTAQVVSSFIYRKAQTFSIRLLYEKQQGTQAARECGRRAAEGDIIAQLDADCLPPSTWITTGVKLLLHENNCVAVAGPYDYFDSPFFIRLLTSVCQQSVIPVLSKISQYFKRGGCMLGGNVFIKAGILKQMGGYDTSLTFYGDDADTAKKVSTFGKILFTNKLMVKSSSRRYGAAGFFKVQSRYTKAFLQTLFYRGPSRQESMEVFHPR